MALIPWVWMNCALRKGMYFLQEETLCRGENGYASVPTTSFVYSTKSCFIAQSLITTLYPMKCSSLIVERNYQNLVSFFFYIGTSHKGSQFESCRESWNSIFVAKLHISKNEWSLPQSSYDTWKPEPNPITQSAKTDTTAVFSISNFLLSPLQGNLLAPRWPVIVKDRPYITLHVK